MRLTYYAIMPFTYYTIMTFTDYNHLTHRCTADFCGLAALLQCLLFVCLRVFWNVDISFSFESNCLCHFNCIIM